jgi:hypothetical protein
VFIHIVLRSATAGGIALFTYKLQIFPLDRSISSFHILQYSSQFNIPHFELLLNLHLQGYDSWGLENFHRNTLARAFAPHAAGVGLMKDLVSGSVNSAESTTWKPHADDIILVADVDEIVKPDVLQALSRCSGKHASVCLLHCFVMPSAGWTGPAFLYSRFYNFRFEWEFAGPWKHPQVHMFFINHLL